MSGPTDEPVGSAAEEAARLLGAVADWARGHGGEWGSLIEGADVHLATGAAECQWCPVCRAIRLLRAASPEVREHLSAAASSFAQAAAALLATAGPEPHAGVERIDLDDPDGWPDEGPEDQA